MASHQIMNSHALAHCWRMKLGASDHSAQRGDQKSSSADEPSRALLIRSPSCPIRIVIAMPAPIASSRCCAARRGDPAGADLNATAIGSSSSGNAEAIGRAGDAAPPHQMWKAPTSSSNALKTKVISTAWRRNSPRARHIWNRPVPAST